MNVGKPKISVIIPAKNAGKVISNCLEAVFAQSYELYEVIVVDGYSTDKTVEKAKVFPVEVFYEDYGAVGGARQVGLEKAKGEYVAFTDADCIPEKNWLKNLVKEFSGDVMGIGGGIKNIGEGIWGKSIALIIDTFLGSANSVQGRLFKEKRFVKSISGCNSMYRRETLLKIGGFNVRLSVNEETELNRRLSKIGKLLYTPDAVVLHDQGRGLRDFAKRIYQFGCGRGRLRLWDLQCIPPIVALFIILSLVFTYWIFASVMSLYVLILIVMGFRFAMQERDIRYLGSIPIVYAIEHASYAIGFLRGFLKV
jgi:glycosyltransferase involved in cell wall biosynthesis